MLLLGLIMVGAGIVGGIVNYCLLDDKQQTGRTGIIKCVIVGIGASLLIPLFLNTISSQLVDDVLKPEGNVKATLVFAGFCLVAAIVSRNFIQTLSDKVFQRLKETEEKTEELKKDLEVVEQAVEVTKEPDIDASAATPSAGTSIGMASTAPTLSPTVSEEEAKLLQAMKSSKYTLRSVSGLAAQVGMDHGKVVSLLSGLESRGFLTRVLGKKGERWGLTSLADPIVK